MTDQPALSVVIPCYNEEESLPELIRRLEAVCQAYAASGYEIVLIDDGSRDQTRQLIEDFAKKRDDIVGVFLSRNHGHQLALTAGLRICRGERIMILDADLQDPPELLHDMMALMDDGADVVYGKRTERKGESAFKLATAHIFYRLLNRLIDVDIPNDTGDFRLMSRRALNTLNEMPEHHRFIRGMVSWIGYRQVPIEYAREARFAGETKYPFKKMLGFAIDAIAGFSVLPLRFSIYLGFICAILGMLFLGYTAYSYFAGIAVQGWTTLMVVVLILGSGQLLVLGVIGEYLGRLYMQSKKRPLFIIEDIVGLDHNAKAGSESDLRREA
ncbi:MAG: glycosyltransferase family 2 protein [Henriciella sp.]|nr:glycosyltransferase family 2 protein [Henriciella sp.]